MEVKSIHSYRMEAMGLLASLTYLKQVGWTGAIEWHIDCKGVTNTTEKIKIPTIQSMVRPTGQRCMGADKRYGGMVSTKTNNPSCQSTHG